MFVTSCCNPPELFETGKQIFNHMARALWMSGSNFRMVLAPFRWEITDFTPMA